MAGMRGLPAASTVPGKDTTAAIGGATCKPDRNVAEFPAGIGHNYGFRSVTPAQRLRITYGGGWVTQDGY